MTTTLIDNIKKDQLQARKDKNEVSVNLLTTLIGEAEMIGKNDGNRKSTDTEVTTVIKKFVKNLDETITTLTKAVEKETDTEKTKVLQAKVELMEKEKAILMPYLPQQLNDEQLRVEMGKIIAEFSLAGPKGMGVLMKEMKNRFAGAYDGTAASKISKEMLA